VDTLTFIAELVRALAWPLTIFLIFLILRKRIDLLIPMLQRMRYGGLELEFSRQVHELSRQVNQDLIRAQAAPELEEIRRHLVDLAPLSPRAAVLEAWLQVEKAAVEALKRRSVSIPSRDARVPLLLGQALEDAGIMADETAAIYHRLRNLRNTAAHASEFSIEPDLAIEYADLAIRLTVTLQKA
jgi:hypothetical protein